MTFLKSFLLHLLVVVGIIGALSWALSGVTWNVNVPGLGKVGTDNLSEKGFWYDLMYGNPNKPKGWHCS